eukprot:COSAG01_NODE_26513_length_711_cov_7.398693_1_plen_67_part_00
MAIIEVVFVRIRAVVLQPAFPCLGEGCGAMPLYSPHLPALQEEGEGTLPEEYLEFAKDAGYETPQR